MQNNVLGYIRWRGDLSFENDPINEIDALIFSTLSYVPFDGIAPELEKDEKITLKDAADKFFAINGEKINLGAFIPSDVLELLREASKSTRFSKVELWGYVNEVCKDAEKQFSACCFSYGKTTCVVYRGTDDTLVGWKENLNMALFTPIPAQREGAKYLNDISKKTKDKLILTGHSKGGNVAVYSAINVSARLQKRIEHVYSYDGPGFMDEYISTVNTEAMAGKITAIVPNCGYVGRIFNVIGKYKIVKSNDKGAQQHNMFLWHIYGPSFVIVDSFDKSSDNFHDLLEIWVEKTPLEDRHEFVESFYKVLTSSEASTLSEITNQKFKFVRGLIKAEGSNKKVVFDAIFKLIKERNAMALAKRKDKINEQKSHKSSQV